MEFYTYAYVVQRGELTSLLQYGFISIALLALLVIGIKIMYNRFDTKFRDLGIIIILSLIFLLGIQLNDYSQDVDTIEESTYMAQFLSSLSDRMGVNKESIQVNSLRVQDGMIVHVEQTFYEVTLTTKKDGYALRRVQMINPNPKVVDVKVGDK